MPAVSNKCGSRSISIPVYALSLVVEEFGVTNIKGGRWAVTIRRGLSDMFVSQLVQTVRQSTRARVMRSCCQCVSITARNTQRDNCWLVPFL